MENEKSNFTPYSSKGFVLIYNEGDYKNKIISRKLNENELEIGHNKIRKNSIVVITNPENNKSITLPFGTGTLIDIPSNFPFNSGKTIPTAFAAPVDVGIIF